jgi:hypothetical protein
MEQQGPSFRVRSHAHRRHRELYRKYAPLLPTVKIIDSVPGRVATQAAIGIVALTRAPAVVPFNSPRRHTGASAERTWPTIFAA